MLHRVTRLRRSNTVLVEEDEKVTPNRRYRCAVPGTHVWGCGALAELPQQLLCLGYNELLLQRGHMALRVARGLFRLWLILSALWIGAVGIVVWHEKNWMFNPDGLILVPGSTADICSTAKDEQQCFDLLRA